MRWLLKQAIEKIQHGGVIACPTEAVYGLSCDPLNADAVHRLLELKHRPVEQGLILVASHFSQLEPYLAPLPDKIKEHIQASWPGPVTWLWPAAENVPEWLTGSHDTLAVRVTAHPVMSALCEGFGGALVSTSANVSGKRPQRTALGVKLQFRNSLDYILTGTVNVRANPTEIRDALTDEVIRAG